MRKNTTISIIIALCVIFFMALEVHAQLYNFQLPFEREYGKQKVRAEFISYRTVKQAWAKTKDSLENASILNGNWKTIVTSDTASVVRTTETSSWNNVTIPFYKLSNKAPLFTPEKMPIIEEKLKMEAPETFTVFQTDLIIPFDFLDKAIFLHIGAITNKTSVYVNGKKLAVLRESMIPQEVKLNDFVARGMNKLSLVMEPYNEESVLERWNTQLGSSIPADVFVFAQPKIRMFDFTHKTTLDPTYQNGLLEAALVLKTELINTHKVTVFYDLYDMKGRIVNSDYKDIEIGWYKYDTIRFISSIKNVNLWCAKNPYLYTIVYRVKREGRTYENVTRKVGFRQIEVKDSSLLINGEAEPIYGVNADLFPEFTSSTYNTDVMNSTFRKLKSDGYNAIRTPYPLNETFYELADKYGFYVSETAPICSRGLTKSLYKGGTLANNPAWSPAFVSRVVDTYEKGKDHTSIIMWELGEDAGNGCAMYDAYNALRALEQYRPIVYADGGYEWNSDICVDTTHKPVKGVCKPCIPNRMKYDKDFWTSNQGCFIDEKIEGRIGNSSYTENVGIVDNFKEPENVQQSPNLWEKIKAKGKGIGKKKKEKETAAIVTTTSTATIASQTTADEPVTTATETDEPVTTTTETKPVTTTADATTEEKEEVTEPVSGTITAKKIDETTYEIYNGLDKNLNTYKVIHTTIDDNGKMNPVELLTIDLEPGQSTKISLAKTKKNKRAFLLIGGVTKVEL